MAARALEVLYRGIDALNRRDIDGYLAMYSDDAVWIPTEEWAAVGRPTYRGREEIGEIVRSMSEAMDLRVELREALVDGERGLVASDWIGRGRSGGAEASRVVYSAVEVAGEEATRIVNFTGRAAALDAARLSEELTQRVHNLRAAVDAHNTRDYPAMEEIFEPDADWHTSPSFAALGGDVRHGPADITALARAVAEQFDDYRWDVEELIGFGELCVAAMRWHGRGGVSGVEVERPIAGVFDFRGPKIARARIFDTRADALAAAGLPELPRQA